jgi:hypothetical protein
MITAYSVSHQVVSFSDYWITSMCTLKNLKGMISLSKHWCKRIRLVLSKWLNRLQKVVCRDCAVTVRASWWLRCALSFLCFSQQQISLGIGITVVIASGSLYRYWKQLLSLWCGATHALHGNIVGLLYTSAIANQMQLCIVSYVLIGRDSI